MVYIVPPCFAPPFHPQKQTNKQIGTTKGGGGRVWSHSGLAIYIKTYLKAKGDLSKLKYFTMQKYNLQQIL
jgi:hypothetical protein